MKKTHQKQLALAVGGILVGVLMLTAVTLRGELFTGDLANLPGNAATDFTKPLISMLVPSNQLRPGVNSVLKAKVQVAKPLEVHKLKLNFYFKDLSFSNLHLQVNGNDVAKFLTADTLQKMNANYDDNAGMNKTVVLEFQDGFMFDPGQNMVDLTLNADALTLNSALATTFVDMVAKAANGQDFVVEGPAEKTLLQVNYTAAGN